MTAGSWHRCLTVWHCLKGPHSCRTPLAGPPTHLISSVSSSNSRAVAEPLIGAPLVLAAFTSSAAARTTVRGCGGRRGRQGGVGVCGVASEQGGQARCIAHCYSQSPLDLTLAPAARRCTVAAGREASALAAACMLLGVGAAALEDRGKGASRRARPAGEPSTDGGKRWTLMRGRPATAGPCACTRAFRTFPTSNCSASGWACATASALPAVQAGKTGRYNAHITQH